ncbi:MAG TPA: MASE1 domain-containing protein, partial [Chlamydiales bacterium]|nr:MASE1 domain-containing protein [Chlamydiales bacterium]
LSFAALALPYPAPRLFVPFVMWVAYRFRMHGATLAVFFVTFTGIIAASFGYGSYMANFIVDPMMVLASFLAVVICVSYVIAACINEREALRHRVPGPSLNLQEVVVEDLHHYRR